MRLSFASLAAVETQIVQNTLVCVEDQVLDLDPRFLLQFGDFVFGKNSISQGYLLLLFGFILMFTGFWIVGIFLVHEG